jgi:predicted phage terminase large subunit-like protein
MSTNDKYAAAALAEIRKVRRELGASSPEVFARAYLAGHFSLPMAPMHREMFQTLQGITAKRGSRVAIAAPRGHAKSTVVTLAYALWCVLYGKEPLVIIVSSTLDQASKLLGHVKKEVEDNHLLRADFPELIRARRVSPWKKDTILIPGGSLIGSFGPGSKVRGLRQGKDRPTLILVDDLEDKDAVIHEEQRQKTADWFSSTLLKAGTPDTNVVAVGTVLHHDSLLANLLEPSKSPGWRPMRYQSVMNSPDRTDLWDRWGALYRGEGEFTRLRGLDAAQEFYTAHQKEMTAGAAVLWPERYSYRDLMEIRVREGEAAFMAEMQNEPLDPAACIFAGAKLQYWDSEHPDPARLIKALGRGRFFGACDPSLGNDPARGDYSAIVVLFQPDDGPQGQKVKYVIAADLARRSPDQIIEKILQYAAVYKFSGFGVEANQFQQLLVDELKARARQRDLKVRIRPIKNRANKLQRIAALEAEVSQGLLRFSKAHTVLLDQLKQFPLGKHDDGPDALEMAVATAAQPDTSYIVTDAYTGRVLSGGRYGKGIGFGKEDRMPEVL